MVKKGFDHVDKRFDALAEQVARIEKLMLADHKGLIEKVDTEVKELKRLLSVK